MVDPRHVVFHATRYREEMENRGMDPSVVDEFVSSYNQWRSHLAECEKCLAEKNRRARAFLEVPPEKKQSYLEESKRLSLRIEELQRVVEEYRKRMDLLLPQIPVLSLPCVPIGRSSEENRLLREFRPETIRWSSPRPYYELPLYGREICPEEGVRAFGTRGYYLRGSVALLQKALLDYALEQIVAEGFELFYPPLLLNAEILRGTGHLPDFEGQQYEVRIDEGRSAYLVGSAEPSLMAFFAGKKLREEELPIRVTASTSCFRKEAGSHGKDQKGIVRTHQFEKVEMVVICTAEQAGSMFEELLRIEEKIYQGLGLHYRVMELCTAELPKKHCRQVDIEAFFPGQGKFIEISSNGNAADFQTRSLGIRFTASSTKSAIPWSLNCTGITFRTGLAILEQYQKEDGSVEVPEILRARMGRERIG
ncbi:serine--tRNA ligase [Candidatus Methylacidithermus pantelleriae]|uniref:Serine--tRNA ligase n=1 Tax=Candidatus Methylacidithermus pantelleriae TaxID=2744239 RepID=A0A8J2BNE0_9BACT|nr:serine--tRNA ligase [Candidatus Methylacidithermus pantelleriae]CAF0701236.1 Seryl-tRNA synthetase [Candidatus Methylacidithermus pantelleriae]